MAVAKVDRAVKLAVWGRDGYRCRYCKRTLERAGEGVPDYLIATVDHVIPRSRGGSNKATNLVTACQSCNSAKGSESRRDFTPPTVRPGAGASLKRGWLP